MQAMTQRALPHERSVVSSYVTLSIGLTCTGSAFAVVVSPEAALALLARADQALYTAKMAGSAQAWHDPGCLPAKPPVPLGRGAQ